MGKQSSNGFIMQEIKTNIAVSVITSVGFHLQSTDPYWQFISTLTSIPIRKWRSAQVQAIVSMQRLWRETKMRKQKNIQIMTKPWKGLSSFPLRVSFAEAPVRPRYQEQYLKSRNNFYFRFSVQENSLLGFSTHWLRKITSCFFLLG